MKPMYWNATYVLLSMGGWEPCEWSPCTSIDFFSAYWMPFQSYSTISDSNWSWSNLDHQNQNEIEVAADFWLKGSVLQDCFHHSHIQPAEDEARRRRRPTMYDAKEMLSRVFGRQHSFAARGSWPSQTLPLSLSSEQPTQLTFMFIAVYQLS